MIRNTLFAVFEKSLRVWLSYRTVTNLWNVSLLVVCTDVKAELIQKNLVRLLQHVTKPWVITIFPDLSGNIMQQYNNTKKNHLRLKSCSRYQNMSITVWFMNIYIIPERAPPSSPWCLSMSPISFHCAFQAFLNLRNGK